MRCLSTRLKKDVRLICFAIVTESIEKLYYNDIQKVSNENGNESLEKGILKQINNNLDRRIKHYYLTGIRSGMGLVDLFLKYYNNEIDLNDELINAEYQVFLNVGTKPISYMTEMEVKSLLEQWEKNLDSIDKLRELNSTTDVYVHYSKVLDKDYSLFLERYEKKLNIIMTEMVLGGDETILSYSADVLDISSVEVKKIYNKVCNTVREELIIFLIDNLCNLETPDRKTFEYSYELRKCYKINAYKEIVHKHIDKLYNEKFFPVSDMSDDKHHTCYNIMSILYCADTNKFLEYCAGIKCDRMAQHRLEKLVEEIVNNC